MITRTLQKLVADERARADAATSDFDRGFYLGRAHAYDSLIDRASLRQVQRAQAAYHPSPITRVRRSH